MKLTPEQVRVYRKAMTDGYTSTQALAMARGEQVKFIQSADAQSDIELRSPVQMKWSKIPR